ncbi:hypothetical protein N9H17_06275 [Schleiferiaceae bacterium]|nr:hypothetical protein [Schleiferiaceae bacterium]
MMESVELKLGMFKKMVKYGSMKTEYALKLHKPDISLIIGVDTA